MALKVDHRKSRGLIKHKNSTFENSTINGEKHNEIKEVNLRKLSLNLGRI